MTQGDFGKMPDLKALSRVRGEVPKELRGSMAVVGWMDPDNQAVATTYGKMLDSLYQQFENSPNLHFTTIVKGKGTQSLVNDFAQQHNLPNKEMISFVEASPSKFVETARAFKLPFEPAAGPGGEAYVALVDSSQTIVKHYNLADHDQAIGLVELISVIIPLPERQDIVVDRKREL